MADLGFSLRYPFEKSRPHKPDVGEPSQMFQKKDRPAANSDQPHIITGFNYATSSSASSEFMRDRIAPIVADKF